MSLFQWHKFYKSQSMNENEQTSFLYNDFTKCHLFQKYITFLDTLFHDINFATLFSLTSTAEMN